MPEKLAGYPNKPGAVTYIADWEACANNWVPMTAAEEKRLKTLTLPRPRCPDIPEIKSVEELLPSLDAVAQRQYSAGLWPAWDLKQGEKVLLRVSNWHHPLVIEACRRILTKYGTQFKIEVQDKGLIPSWQGHDEVEYYLFRTKELAQWIDEWEEMDEKGLYDKIIMGYGGPILQGRRTKIQRMPFIVPEAVVSEAHTLPAPVLIAIDEYVWHQIRQTKTIRITDPEGTDLRYTNHDQYWNSDRTLFRRDIVERSYHANIPHGETYAPGHIWGHPPFCIPEEDGEGVVKGTMNHIAPFPRIELHIKNSVIREIKGGGIFGEKLRKVQEHCKDVQYSGFKEPGIMQWYLLSPYIAYIRWEASIGTSPKIHRPRENYATGFNCGLYERMRSGVIHIGFGTIISSDQEREDAKAGKLVGHWHVHLYFPTLTGTTADGETITIIKDGRLCALDAPSVREVAAQYGDPDHLLKEDWIPAIPGLNIAGNYNEHFAKDPFDFTMMELDMCRKYHPLFQRMISLPRDHSHANGTSHANGYSCH